MLKNVYKLVADEMQSNLPRTAFKVGDKVLRKACVRVPLAALNSSFVNFPLSRMIRDELSMSRCAEKINPVLSRNLK